MYECSGDLFLALGLVEGSQLVKPTPTMQNHQRHARATIVQPELFVFKVYAISGLQLKERTPKSASMSNY